MLSSHSQKHAVHTCIEAEDAQSLMGFLKATFLPLQGIGEKRKAERPWHTVMSINRAPTKFAAFQLANFGIYTWHRIIARVTMSGHVNKLVNVFLVPTHVFVLYEPLNLLLNHLLGRKEHVLQDFHKLRLKLGIGDPLPHLHDLHNCFLCPEYPKLHNAFVVFFLALLSRQLEPPNQVDFTPLLYLAIFTT